MPTSNADFIERCNRQARAYERHRIRPDKSTERELRLACAAVRDALQPRADEPMLEIIQKEIALIRAMIKAGMEDEPGREALRSRLHRMELAEANEIRRLKRCEQSEPE